VDKIDKKTVFTLSKSKQTYGGLEGKISNFNTVANYFIVLKILTFCKQWPLAANLLNLSTRRKFAIFGEFEYSPKWSFLKIGRTLYIRPHSPTCFGRTRYIRQPVLVGLDTFAHIRQPTLLGLDTFAHIRQRLF
jgi:hypothetical protein